MISRAVRSAGSKLYANAGEVNRDDAASHA